MTAIARTAALFLAGGLALAACGTQEAADRPGGPIVPVSAAPSPTTTTTTAPAARPSAVTTPERTATTTPTSTTRRSTRSTTTTSRRSVSAATVLAEFRALVKEHCAPAFTGGDTHVPMPTAKSARYRSGSTWLVRDDANVEEMLFDRAAGTVTSKQGPDGSLGQEYVFQCDPEVFISPVS